MLPPRPSGSRVPRKGAANCQVLNQPAKLLRDPASLCPSLISVRESFSSSPRHRADHRTWTPASGLRCWEIQDSKAAGTSPGGNAQ